MIANINKTFRDNLLDSPRPTERELFAILFNSMFPSGEDFEHFLDATRHEVQANYAKRILLNLCTQSSLLPTNRLLLNLMAFEAQVAGHSPRDHVGRDHFVHLVHLYLFGLYLFWYHKGFHDTLMRHFISLAPPPAGLMLFSDRREIGARLFLSAWTNFILLHDVAYPLEIADESGRSYVKPLGRIQKSLEKELALLCISRLVAFQMLLDLSGKPTILEESYNPILAEIESASAQTTLFQKSHFNIKSWRHARRMPTGLGISILPLLKVLFTPINILAALEHSANRIPAWLIEESTRCEVFPQSSNRRDESQEQVRGFAEAFKRGTIHPIEPPHFDLVFYVRDFDECLLSVWRNCVGNECATLEDLKLLARNYAKTDPPPYNFGSPHYDFHDCVFHVYQALLRDMDYVADDDDNDTSTTIARLTQKFKLAKRAVRNLEKRLVSELISHLAEQIKRRSRNLTAENVRLRNGLTHEYVKELLRPLADTKCQTDLFTSKMSDALRRQVEVDSILRLIYNGVRKQITTAIGIREEEWGQDPKEYRHLFTTSWQKIPDSGLLRDISKKFEDISGIGWSEVQNYRPDYVEQGVDYVDHGMGAAWVGCKIANLLLYSFQLERRSSAIEVSTLGVNNCFGCDSLIARKIYEETLYAILVHNIYPEYFKTDKGRAFRTKIQESPFAYFAIFADSLQPWDRKRLVNPAYSESVYSTSSDAFNIELHGQKLYISERGQGLRIDDRINVLRGHLDSYLEGASSLIRLSLGEWPS